MYGTGGVRSPATPGGEGWSGTRPPRSVIDFVKRRDNWTCIDCGPRRRWPDSLLEVDHDDELADDGTNDPANLVTRCLDHHDAKTQETRMARTADQKPTRNARAAKTAALPERPGFGAHARAVCALAVFAVGAHGALWALGRDNARALAVAWAGCSLLVLAAWGVRYVRWRRTCEAQRVYERLAKVADVPNAGRRDRFKVSTWRGVEPAQVTITPGAVFPLDDPAALRRLADAFAAALGVAAAEVTATRAPRGRVLLARIDPGERAADTPTEDAHDPEPEATPGARAEVTARVRDALSTVLDSPCEVRITDWHPDGAPAAGMLAYPPAATKNARDARADLPVVLADVYRPRTTNGRWRVTWEPNADRFRFRDEPDPLAPIVPLPPIEDTLDLEAGPIVGVTEDGKPWRQPLLHSHVLVAGATGAGKGSVLWGLIRGVMHLVHDGRVKLWVIDPKGGMELGLLEPVAHRFATAEGAPELLAEAAEVMEAQAQRLRRAGSRKLETPTPENPLHIVIVDELAALTSLAGDSKVSKETNANMGRLLTQGRAVGVCVIGALQDPRAKNLDNRNLFPFAVALRLKERQMVDMVLGAGARASGAVCDLIPRALPGVGYVVADGMAETLRVRAAFVTDDELARVIRAQQPPPAHAQRAQVGEQLALDARAGEPVPLRTAVAEVAETLPPPGQKAKPVRVAALTPGAHVRLPDDEDPVRIVSVEPDPDDPEDRVEVTYVYDGETGERCASFERSDEATPT